MSDYYIFLSNGKALKANNKDQYVRWWKRKPREMRTSCGVYLDFDKIHGTIVSTVFLGRPHGSSGKTPVLWETAILSPEGKDFWRYSSADDAKKGHKYICKQLENSNGKIEFES